MEIIRINGALAKKLLQGGVQELRLQMDAINDLNVFPVPDGDTGTNMEKTLVGGLARVSEQEDLPLGQLLSVFARGCVLSARGNSGVILSQYIAGVCAALEGKDEADAKDLAAALKAGVDRAYHAVSNPVEGTILTVFRESAEYTYTNTGDDTTPEQMLMLCIEQARVSLARTKELLPVLAEADVVDSGGAGYLAILTGVYDALAGKEIHLDNLQPPASAASAVNYDLFTTDSEIGWGYCTECLVRLQRAKGDPEAFDLPAFVAALEQKNCNSIVALRDLDVLKVHAHTVTPSDVLTLCQQFGEFLEVKIENMTLQHSERTRAQAKSKREHKTYGVIAVACGEGMHALFGELGADVIIDGGQTANPSAQDFLSAIEELNADHILILPNNGNILLTAQQAAGLCEEVDVHVVPTKSFPQGFAALSVFNGVIGDVEEQVADMTDAKDAVASGEITWAIRDTVIGGVQVKKGESIGILDGELVCSQQDEIEAMCKMLGAIEDIEDREILTLFVGNGVTEQERVAMTEAIEENFEDLSVDVYVGGQEVYRYLVAVE